MSPDAKEAVRRRLDQLGKRRKKQEKREEKLQDEVREAVAEARLANVPMQEAAERLGLNRTTIYQVYLVDISADDREAAAAAAA